MKFTKKLIKWGGSLGVTLPFDIVQYLDLREDDTVELDVCKIINPKHKLSQELRCRVCGVTNYISEDDIEIGFVNCSGCDCDIMINKGDLAK